MTAFEGEQYMNTATDTVLITKMELTFIRDLPGFNGAQHFVVEPVGDALEGVFAQLRCTDMVYTHTGRAIENLTLLVMSPGVFWQDYEVRIDEAMVEELGLSRAEDVVLLAIVHPQDPLSKSTANLYSPIVINRHTRLADQLVPGLGESEIGWSVRTPFPTEEEE